MPSWVVSNTSSGVGATFAFSGRFNSAESETFILFDRLRSVLESEASVLSFAGSSTHEHMESE